MLYPRGRYRDASHRPLAGRKRSRGQSSRPGHIIDIMAALVDITGAEYPFEFRGEKIQLLEGRSLVPAFSGKRIEREALFFEHEGNRAVVTADWKIVAPGAKAPWELYDMNADGTETNDLALVNTPLVSRLAEMWDGWRAGHVS